MPETLQKNGSLLLINGLDVSAPAEFIRDNASPNVQNFFVDRAVLTKRSGTTEFGATASEQLQYGTEFEREGTKFNVRIGLTKIQRYNVGTQAWVDIQGSALTGSATDIVDTAVPLLSSKEILCITNGIDAIQKWTGSGNTADLGGTPPKGKYIQEYKTYLVVANITGGIDVAQRVQWSDTSAPETWTGGNSGSNDLVEDGGDITGMALFGNYLAVHKESSIYLGYLVNTSNIFRFDRKSTGAGTVSNNTIINLPTSTGHQVFLASDGIRLFNGISAPLIPSPMNDEIRDSLNTEFAEKSWAVLVKERDEVWIGVPIGDQETGDTVYRYNYRDGTVYKDIRSGITFGWRAEQTSSLTWDDMVGTWDSQSSRWNDNSSAAERPLINLSDTSGSSYIVQDNATNDAGTAIEAMWETKDFTSNDKFRMVRWQQIEFDARGGSVTVEYSVDEGETWDFISNSPLNLSSSYPSDSSPIVGYFDEVSTKIRFRFCNNSTTEILAIKQFLIYYSDRELRS